MFDIIKLKEKFYLNKIFKNKTNLFIKSIGTINKYDDYSLIFISKQKYSVKSINNIKAIILTDIVTKKRNNVIFTKKPRLTFCKILNILIKKKLIKYPMIKNKISNSSNISESADVGENIRIGKNSIVEKGAIIHNNTIIGSNCHIKSGAIIGGECFSFERENNKTYNFPYFGNVVIGNNVEIGSNSLINKSNFGSTRIGNNTKIDNLVQIAHNSKIGENVTITSSVQVGGGVVIKNNVWICPSSSIMSGLKIEKDAYIGIGSIVIKSVRKNSRVFGNPAREIKNGN